MQLYSVKNNSERTLGSLKDFTLHFSRDYYGSNKHPFSTFPSRASLRQRMKAGKGTFFFSFFFFYKEGAPVRSNYLSITYHQRSVLYILGGVVEYNPIIWNNSVPCNTRLLKNSEIHESFSECPLSPSTSATDRIQVARRRELRTDDQNTWSRDWPCY